MTQHDIILAMLRQGPVCGNQFLRAYLPTYSQRIGELIRRKGYRIYRVKCPYSEHSHQSGIATYELSRFQGGSYDDRGDGPRPGIGLRPDQVPSPDRPDPEPEPPERDDFDEQYADMKARANDPPDPEPPGDWDVAAAAQGSDPQPTDWDDEFESVRDAAFERGEA